MVGTLEGSLLTIPQRLSKLLRISVGGKYNSKLKLLSRFNIATNFCSDKTKSIIKNSQDGLDGGIQTIHDFKHSKPIKLERKDTLDTHYFFTSPKPSTKKYIKVKTGKENLIFWNHRYFETWKMTYEGN